MLGDIFKIATGLDFSFISTFLSSFFTAVIEGTDIVLSLLNLVAVIFQTMPTVIVTTIVLVVGIRIIFNIL